MKRFLPAPVRRLLGGMRRQLAGPQARRYIPAGMSVSAFFAVLKAEDIKCVVLRWFETLPDVALGEDIDMLVADEDLPRLARLLAPKAGSTPCDIYSVSGLKGTRYKDLAYFPQALAQSTIANCLLYKDLFLVPAPEDHFMGLAYHAVYQKGPASGLPSRYADIQPLAQPEHDYAGHLQRLAARLGLPGAIDMESLDAILHQRGYRPEGAMRAALMPSNPWIERHLTGV